ncbi:MAG: hypothetical protein AB7E96_10030 [Deferribacterales bacterium]
MRSLHAEPFGDDFFPEGFAEAAADTKEKALFFSGYAEETFRHFTVKDGILQNRQKIFLEQQFKTDHVRGYISEIFENDTEKAYGRKAESSLDEAFITLDTRRLDVIAGKKMLRWGTGDGINPMDLINPKDSGNLFSTARSDNREAVLLAEIIYTSQPLTYELVILPSAEVMSMPEYGNPWLGESMKKMYEAAAEGHLGLKYEDKPESAEAAFRTYGTFGSTDIGLIIFSGYDDNPFYTQTDGVYTVGYKPLTAYGINFASGMGRSTLRGEFSLKHNKYVQHADKPRRHDFYEWVLGYDMSFRNSGYINFQLFGSYTDGDDLPADRETRGVSFEVSEKYFQDDLSAGVRGTVYLSDRSGAAEVFISYKYGDDIVLSAGYMNIFGGEDTAYGQFTENDFIYSGIKFSF